MDQIKRNLYELLFSCKGNWRNAIYVPCGPCPHPCKVDRSGCLVAIRQDGAPLLVGVREFEEETGERIDPGDCIAAIGYLHAVQRYFTEKSLHRYRFSTIAWRSMNSSLNTFRRQEQRRQSHEFSCQAAHPPPDDAFDALRARLLLHDLFLLADEEQALLIRHRLHGCSLAETARREGMSIKRVRHRLKALYRAYFAQEKTKQKEL